MLGHVARGLGWGGTETRVGADVNVVLSLNRGLEVGEATDVSIEVAKDELRPRRLDVELSQDRPK